MELFSIQAEQAVIGGLLIDEKAIDRIGHLEPWHFVTHENREIFSCMRGMALANKPIDVVTVTEALGNNAAHVGGIMYLGQLAQNTPGSANIKHYADMILEKARLRELMEASQNIAAIVDSQGDVADKINRAQAEVMKLSESVSKRDPLHVRDVLRFAVESIDRRAMHEIDGMLTGLRDLDGKLSGLKNGDLVIIAARPAMGKSTLAVQIAYNIAEHGLPALILSQEMSYQQLADRLIASAGRVSMTAITTGKIEQDEWDKIAVGISKLHEIPLYLDDQGSMTIADVCSKARMLKRKHGLSLLVVDYLQLMSGNSDNRNTAIEEISRGLKSLAKELHIPVIALSQLSRECEKRQNKRPMLSDLRDSGAIEQDADVVMFIYRDEEYNPQTNEPGIAEILIRKNRQGKTGDIRMLFAGDYSRFDDLAHGYVPPEPKQMRRAQRDDL